MLSSQDLHFFYVVATSKSLSAAAKKLNVTAPTVTQRLQSLEAKLSLKLVERDSRQSTLTASGKKLASRCKAILDDIDSLTDELKDQQNSLSGTLTVLAPVGFGEKHVAPAIGAFYQRYPELKIRLLLSDHPDKDASPESDVVIYIGELKNSSMRRIVLAKNQRLICASPTYLAKHPPILCPDDLAQHQCIGLLENNEDTLQWSFTHKGDSRHSNIRIHPQLVCNVADAVKVWALEGLGIIHRSEWDVATELKQGLLEQVLPNYQLPDADIVALLSTTERDRPRKVSVFVDFLKQRLSDLNNQTS